MTKIITIKEANISTLSVELKAIHLNSKQMTLSVFRQIQEENCFDEGFNLQGELWGTVNYFWDKCHQQNDTVFHVVWQKGNELRRCRMSDIHERGDYWHCIENINWRFWGCLEYELEEITKFLSGKKTALGKKRNAIHFPSYYETEGKFFIDESWSAIWRESKISDYKESTEIFNKYLIRQKEIEKLIPQKKIEAANYIDNWRKSYQKIASLPQLYIAA
jgi:hypothetical protein